MEDKHFYKKKYFDDKRAGAFIMNNSLTHVLLVHQIKSEMWGIPKGRKKKNESDIDCMKREVKEEINIILDDLPHKIIGQENAYIGGVIFYVQLDTDERFKCHPPNEDGKENHEIDIIEWFPLKKIDKSNKKFNYYGKMSIQKRNNVLNKNIKESLTLNNNDYLDIF